MTDEQTPADSGCEASVPLPDDPVLRAALDSCIRGTVDDDDHEEQKTELQEKSPETPETLLKKIWGYDGFCRGVGHVNAFAGLLCCKSEEIARHMSRYFMKEIFEAVYAQHIGMYEWIDEV